MKKIINGKKYDTETAKMLGDWDNGNNDDDFNYCSESLYRKKTGEYFLYGEGGARTGYARTVGSNWYAGGWNIKPMTEEEAREWAVECLDCDTFESIFGEVEE